MKEIFKFPFVRPVFLFYVKYNHTEDHAEKQTGCPQSQGTPVYVIALKNQIGQYKGRVIGHNHIVTA